MLLRPVLKHHAALFLSCVLTGLLAIQTIELPRANVVLWPPCGIAIIFFYTNGVRLWPAFWLAEWLLFFIVCRKFDASQNYSTLEIMASCALLASVTALQPIFAARLLKMALGESNRLTRLRDVLWFLVIAGPIQTVIGGMVAARLLANSGYEPGVDFFTLWMECWFPAMLGAIIFAPITIMYLGTPRAFWRLRRNTVCIPLILAIFGFCGGYYVIHNFESAITDRQFRKDSETLIREVDAELQRAVGSTEQFRKLSAADFLAQHEKGSVVQANLEQFHAYIPWCTEAVAILKVSEDRRKDFERIADAHHILQADGQGGFAAARPRVCYFPVTAFYPLSNRRPLSYDLGNEQGWSWIVDQAAFMKRPVLDPHRDGTLIRVVVPCLSVSSSPFLPPRTNRLPQIHGFVCLDFDLQSVIDRAEKRAENRLGLEFLSSPSSNPVTLSGHDVEIALFDHVFTVPHNSSKRISRRESP